MHQQFPTVSDYIDTIRKIHVDYGTDAATGELVTMYNRLRAAGIEPGTSQAASRLCAYVDGELAQRVGWDMDKAGYLYMV